ncbi:hypothetical protein NDU88_006911, partial [Pleurodeles waltl]
TRQTPPAHDTARIPSIKSGSTTVEEWERDVMQTMQCCQGGHGPFDLYLPGPKRSTSPTAETSFEYKWVTLLSASSDE